jgi:hypothetical protein
MEIWRKWCFSFYVDVLDSIEFYSLHLVGSDERRLGSIVGRVASVAIKWE